jgi:hypothetical protein
MIITIVVSLVVIVAIVVIVATMPNANRCTGDCNQGRNCTCKDQ